MQQVICPQCQAMNQQDWAFCGNCGNPLGQPAPGPGGRESLQQSASLSDYGPGTPVMSGPPRAADPPGVPHYGYDPGAQAGWSAPGAQDGWSAPGAQDGRYPPGAQSGWSGPGTPAGWSGPGTPAPVQQFSLDLRRLNRVDQTVGGASLVVLLSVFLPWFGVDGIGVSGMTAHGYLALVAILAVVLVAYLVLRSGWDEFPLNLPIAHAQILLIGTTLQLLLVLIGFVSVPYSLNWEIGAYLALIASAVAAGPLVVPAIRAWQGGR